MSMQGTLREAFGSRWRLLLFQGVAMLIRGGLVIGRENVSCNHDSDEPAASRGNDGRICSVKRPKE